MALAVVFLREPLTARKFAGLACAVLTVGTLIARRLPDGLPARRATLGSLARVGVATAAIGITNYIYKVGLSAGATASSLLTAQACVVAGLALGLVRITDGEVRVPRGAWRHAGIAGMVLALAFIALTEGLVRGQVSVVVPIAQLSFVVTAVLGIVVMTEPFSARTALGLRAAAGAIALLAPD